MTHGKPSSTRPATPGGETPPADRTASEPKASADPSNAAPAPTAAQRVGAGLRDLKSRVSTARVLVPINNWDFAERVWAGLRPHLRTRLWVLDALLERGQGTDRNAEEQMTRLEQLATEIREVEAAVDDVLSRRTSLHDFSSLLEHRLTPCLGQLELLQEALHQHSHDL